MKLRRVVVTGLGAVSPIGNDVPTMWENAKAGVSGAGPITHFDASMFKTNFACEVKNFDAAEFLDKKEVRKVDAHSHYGIAAAMEAMRDCGIDLEKENLDRFGVIYGEGVGGLRAFEQEYGSYVMNQSNGPRFTPFLITKMITDMT